MPAVLLEAGVIVNRAEEPVLRSARFGRLVASALVRAVADFCAGSEPAPPSSAAERECAQRAALTERR